MVNLSTDMIKRVQRLKEHGYSDTMIARFLDIPVWMVGFMVRRE